MSFQIKDFPSIVASIINHARSTTKKITDWQPASVARTLVEAPAVEIEELYLQMFLGLRDAIPVATFKSFGFEKLAAAKARGFVNVTSSAPVTQPFTVPVGTSFATSDGRTYLSTEAVQWGYGLSAIQVPVMAEESGSAYNVAAGAIESSPAFGTGFTVSNQAIITGRDIESDIERETRFASFIAALSRGTVEACLYAARQAVVTDLNGNITEYVTRIGYTETVGYMKIFIYSSAGTPSAQLVANGQRIIDGSRGQTPETSVAGYRAGGVRVDIIPMIERSVDFSAQVRMQSGYSLTPAVIQAMRDAFASALLLVDSGSTLYIGTIETALLDVEGVLTVVPSLTSNLLCADNEVLKVGTFEITAL